MVMALRNERSMTNPPGSRTLFAVAVLIVLSSLAKTTATLVLDLPSHGAPVATPAFSVAALNPSIILPILKKPRVLPPTPRPKPSRAAHLLTGLASWYGAVLQDHTTASGAPFDMAGLTAAHRSLPFGTVVRVTDLRNRRSVLVTITDRGILNADRIIDLSYAAAEQLNMIKSGVDPVRLDVLKKQDAAGKI